LNGIFSCNIQIIATKGGEFFWIKKNKLQKQANSKVIAPAITRAQVTAQVTAQTTPQQSKAMVLQKAAQILQVRQRVPTIVQTPHNPIIANND